jgi:hemolysin activation/secretion protein
MPFIIPGYNPDDGLHFGIGFKYKKQKWGKAPFGWEQSFRIEYATQSGFLGFGYKGLFKHVFGKWDLDLIAMYRGPKFVFNYYGTGNETELIVNDKTFYRTGLKALSFNPGITRETNHVYVRFSLEYDEVKVLKTPGKFISSSFAEVDPRIFSRQHFAGVRGDWSYSSADVKKNPTRGVNIEAGFNGRDNLDKTSSYLNLRGSFSFYQSLGKSLVFAHRTGAATNFGDYDIYFANTLGRSENLRGFWRYRFSGKTSFYQNTELRLSLSKRKNFGMLGFFDDGRVWIEDEDSKTFHVGYGGGLYFIPFNNLGLNLSYATSKETSMILIKTGFLF